MKNEFCSTCPNCGEICIKQTISCGDEFSRVCHGCGLRVTLWHKWREMLDRIEMAWVIIANAHGGNWDQSTPEWKLAAEKWRDEVFPKKNNVEKIG